jgi:predicted CopG family antitoxin
MDIYNLKILKSIIKKQSLSEVILRHIPAKRKLSETLDEIGRDDDS